MRLVRKFADPKANTVYVETTLTEAAREFGITGNALGYKSVGKDETEDTVLCSILGNKLIPAEMDTNWRVARRWHSRKKEGIRMRMGSVLAKYTCRSALYCFKRESGCLW